MSVAQDGKMASSKAEQANDRRPDPDGFEAPEGLVVVAVFDDGSQAADAGLAILAMGAAYWMMPHHAAYVICVAAAHEAAVRRELAELAALARVRPPAVALAECEFTVGWRSFGVWALLLIGFFLWPQQSALVECGRVDALAMVEQGQWWRAVTALTLHADVVHLLSNLLAGAGFAWLVGRFFSAALGWCLIVLCGVGGNLLNTWVYYPAAHTSIGASTAVFAALGLLTGVGIWAALVAPERHWSMSRWLLPLFGGLTLLGLLGTGAGRANVDVAAHLSGFLCGLLVGGLAARLPALVLRLRRPLRWLLGGLPVALIALAWYQALAC